MTAEIKTQSDLIHRLRALSKEMQTLGASMIYFGGFNVEMAKRGGDLFEDGQVVAGWVDEMVVNAEVIE